MLLIFYKHNMFDNIAVSLSFFFGILFWLPFQCCHL